MPNTIAEYYNDELLDWKNTISFCNSEIDEFSMKLGDVIRQNSITGIADRVESQQSLISVENNYAEGNTKQ